MSYDREKAFEVPNDGFLVEGGPHITGGPLSPLSLVPTGPTLYFKNSGELWLHDGVTEWKRLLSAHFSYRKIDEEIKVPENQQMFTVGSFEITSIGSFEILESSSLVITKG